MTEIIRTKKEYGGFLPLELNLGGNQPYYHEYPNILSFNTVKAALPLVSKVLKAKKIHAPYYLCPNVIKELEKSFDTVEYYYLNDNLLPRLDNLRKKTVYLVDFFGIMDKAITEYVNNNPETTFLIDNAHSFYNKPFMRNNVYNLYSCKKFFGVPDGGYLISERIIDQVYEKTTSSNIAKYLIKSLEEGTNSCYKEKKAVDEYINNNYSGISLFAEELLSHIDYKRIKEIRKNNFNIYQQYFMGKNHIICETGSIPYIYPLNIGKNIKAKLIKEKIYVPTLWSQVLNNQFYNTIEQKLAADTLFLPLDQRYDEQDIEFIVKRVITFLKEEKNEKR